MTKASASPWTPPRTPTSRGLPLPPTSPPPPELSRLPTPARTTPLSPRLASRSPSGPPAEAAARSPQILTARRSLEGSCRSRGGLARELEFQATDCWPDLRIDFHAIFDRSAGV